MKIIQDKYSMKIPNTLKKSVINKKDITNIPKKNDYIIKKKKNFIFIKKIQLLFVKLLIFNNLLPLYLSDDNSKELRKLYIYEKINITITGKGYLKFISDKSQIYPRYIKIKDTYYDSYKKLNFVNDKDYNLTLLFENYYNTFSFKSLFEGLTAVKRVDLSEFNKRVTDTSYMFYNCKNLEYVNFGDFDTSKVTTMAYMFAGTIMKLLNLKSFDTSSVSNMSYMFSNCKQLISLDLSSFDTSKVTKMEKMFYNCESLLFINLYSFTENKNVNIDYIFDNTQDDLIYCINVDNVGKIKNKLQNKINENNCNHDCFQENKKIIPEKKECLDKCSLDSEYIYEYENICYNYFIGNSDEVIDTDKNNEEIIFDITNEDKETNETNKDNDNNTDKDNNNDNGNNNELMENCTTEDFFKGLCDTENKILSTETKDNMINVIIDNIISGNLNDLLTEITTGEKNDFYIKEDDVIFQITTTENQNNKEYNNVSTINLGECEDVLKDKYGISKNLSLIILKIDYFMEGLLIPIIGYEVFDPITKIKLNLSYCQDFLINYNIPVSINEENLERYNPNSSYYNDECTGSTSENGTDITLNDRQIQYNENNMSLCENNCTFTEYNSNSKKSVCMCEIKSKIYTISEILESKETVSKDFNIEDKKSSSSSSVNTMKCFNTLFSKYGLLKNIGNYILIFIISAFMASSVIFYKIGYCLLETEIRNILFDKEKNEKGINIYKFEQNNHNKIKRKKKKRKTKKSSTSVNYSIANRLSNPNRKSVRKTIEVSDSNSTIKENFFSKSISKIEFKKHQPINNHLNKEKMNGISKPFIKEKLCDYELNNYSYKDALEKDKRTIMEYYMSLIRLKHPIVFSFFPIKDYNTIIIKIDIFLISFAVCYSINALFFNETTIHQIYEDQGKYNLFYFLPKIILSFILSHIIVVIIKYFFLSEKNILDIKNKEKRSQAVDEVDKVKRCIIIKYIIFYVIGSFFLILFWYYLSSFCAVYQNSQIFLIINTFISFSISLLYPFFINLIPMVIRKFSLSANNREWIYKTCKIIQLI